MLDFHAHILPGADHGSDGLETSMAQMRLAEQAGINTLIATPHFYPQIEELDTFLERRQACWEALNDAYDGPIKLLLGAEIHMCSGLDHMEGLEQLCIQGTNVLLLELGFRAWSQEIKETLLRIYEDNKFVPVLAHIDRYNPEKIDELLSAGIYAQLNAEAFCRLFGKKQLISWVDNGSVVALGSDIHGTAIGYKQYLKAKDYLKERFHTVMQRTCEMINRKPPVVVTEL